MSDPTFGISITRIDNEPRPPVWSDMSVVGIIGTAPDADAAVFPTDTPVFLYSDDGAKLTALGEAGTLKDALVLLNAQLGEFQVAAKVVLVRVEDGVDTAATIANVVGDGALTGLSAFLRAGPEIGMIPRLLCAPGFTSQRTGAEANPVCAALPPICEKLLAHAVVDGPATTEQDAIDWRETISSSRLIPVDPAVKVYAEGVSVVQPASPAIIGIGVRRDHEKQGRPFHSWANQPVQGIVGPSRPINFSLTDGATEGQRLLSANIGVLLRGEMGVESAIGQGGFIFVGTDNAGEDDLWRFYNVTRGRDFIHLMLLRTLRFYLGRFNVTGQTIQAILNTMETGLRNLKADGDILGFELKFTRDQNTPEELRQGRFTVSFAAEEAPVLRYLGIQSARYRPALDALLDDLLAQVGTITG
ncbi:MULTISPECIES: phage tail protein [unclassified Aliiroseovarius]|uniref:phage tail sheath family protein n=1 Tax=unclassified Aliiroseovarius TaxID=2623558 RepID=UPI001568C63E|nr:MULTISPECIES: phage tail protein [unclassified Aliiroseovarius]NRP30853.1 putative prophage major tail sheath protein [Aliiroseovarius sp. xm-m-314]NRP80495.1 putative prophage major tail sheath protein [Aliiroseovarius sp. xm-v-209]